MYHFLAVYLPAIETEYTISVQTGDKRGCGTDANVFLLIFGQNGSSGELALKESKNNSDKFERGQTDVFSFKMLSLGKPSMYNFSYN